VTVGILAANTWPLVKAFRAQHRAG